MNNRREVTWFGFLAATLFPACEGTRGAGDVLVFVDAEETITNGLRAGSEMEDIKDGWNVTFSAWYIVLGNFKANSALDGDELHEPALWALDMQHVPAGG